MNTNFPIYKSSKPTEGQLAWHNPDKPHYRPNTIQEHIHQILKKSKQSRKSIVDGIKGY